MYKKNLNQIISKKCKDFLNPNTQILPQNWVILLTEQTETDM